MNWMTTSTRWQNSQGICADSRHFQLPSSFLVGGRCQSVLVPQFFAAQCLDTRLVGRVTAPMQAQTAGHSCLQDREMPHFSHMLVSDGRLLCTRAKRLARLNKELAFTVKWKPGWSSSSLLSCGCGGVAARGVCRLWRQPQIC